MVVGNSKVEAVVAHIVVVVGNGRVVVVDECGGKVECMYYTRNGMVVDEVAVVDECVGKV